jgi:hypothetical protein
VADFARNTQWTLRKRSERMVWVRKSNVDENAARLISIVVVQLTMTNWYGARVSRT